LFWWGKKCWNPCWAKISII